ncbi:hypothetical protein SAFG77S_00843 [Streptomyces afghaniensis]
MAPDTYFAALLANGAWPFRHRGCVRALLGMPDDSGPPLVADPLPVGAGFTYLRSCAPDAPLRTQPDEGGSRHQRHTPGEPSAESFSSLVGPRWTQTEEPSAGVPDDLAVAVDADDRVAVRGPVVEADAESPRAPHLAGAADIAAHEPREGDKPPAAHRPAAPPVHHIIVPGKTTRPDAVSARQSTSRHGGQAPTKHGESAIAVPEPLPSTTNSPPRGGEQPHTSGPVSTPRSQEPSAGVPDDLAVAVDADDRVAVRGPVVEADAESPRAPHLAGAADIAAHEPREGDKPPAAHRPAAPPVHQIIVPGTTTRPDAVSARQSTSRHGGQAPTKHGESAIAVPEPLPSTTNSPPRGGEQPHTSGPVSTPRSHRLLGGNATPAGYRGSPPTESPPPSHFAPTPSPSRTGQPAVPDDVPTRGHVIPEALAFTERDATERARRTEPPAAISTVHESPVKTEDSVSAGAHLEPRRPTVTAHEAALPFSAMALTRSSRSPARVADTAAEPAFPAALGSEPFDRGRDSAAPADERVRAVASLVAGSPARGSTEGRDRERAGKGSPANRMPTTSGEAVPQERPPSASAGDTPSWMDRAAPWTAAVGEYVALSRNPAGAAAFWERRHINRFRIGILR